MSPFAPPPQSEGIVHTKDMSNNKCFHMRFAIILSAVDGDILEAVRLAGLLSRRDYSKKPGQESAE